MIIIKKWFIVLILLFINKDIFCSHNDLKKPIVRTVCEYLSKNVFSVLTMLIIIYYLFKNNKLIAENKVSIDKLIDEQNTKNKALMDENKKLIVDLDAKNKASIEENKVFIHKLIADLNEKNNAKDIEQNKESDIKKQIMENLYLLDLNKEKWKNITPKEIDSCCENMTINEIKSLIEIMKKSSEDKKILDIRIWKILFLRKVCFLSRVEKLLSLL